MNAPAFKTRSEQKLEWLGSVKRPLTELESDELRRALHATYCRNLRLAKAARLEREAYPTALNEHASAEAGMLGRVLSEAHR